MTEKQRRIGAWPNKRCHTVCNSTTIALVLKQWHHCYHYAFFQIRQSSPLFVKLSVHSLFCYSPTILHPNMTQSFILPLQSHSLFPVSGSTWMLSMINELPTFIGRPFLCWLRSCACCSLYHALSSGRCAFSTSPHEYCVYESLLLYLCTWIFGRKLRDGSEVGIGRYPSTGKTCLLGICRMGLEYFSSQNYWHFCELESSTLRPIVLLRICPKICLLHYRYLFVCSTRKALPTEIDPTTDEFATTTAHEEYTAAESVLDLQKLISPLLQCL